jgi:hydroxymethylpyrimidine/phosphomethylpyrimidine kinase
VGEAPAVLDPVMVAESGAPLLADDARDALRDSLVPLAAVTTPNLAEAEVLAQAPGTPEELARRIHALGASAVVVTGGHRDEEATDVFFDGEQLVEIPGERHRSGAAHGSGCTHSSALAAYLARGEEPLEAARKAKEVAARAVKQGLRDLGRGVGPVDVIGLRDL